ncbi:MAG: prepilin-type N-terminal cleavage/methylation domain-containing protein [Gammaproteobacteria bacterium]|jgi:prepilin-type N-terminal cleavage/methylation domain-containing protein
MFHCQQVNSSQAKVTTQQGFTLIEMVMVIVILGVLAALTAPIFSQGLTAARLTTENLSTLAKLRYATERLAREIRQVNNNGSGYDVSTMTPANMVFTKVDSVSTIVSITVAGGDITLGYSSPAVTGTLTDEVSSASFVYYDSSGAVTANNVDLAFVEINLTLQNPVTGGSYSQRTRVALRDQS